MLKCGYDERRAHSCCETDLRSIFSRAEFFIFDYFERASADD